jgi:integrase
MAKVLTKLALDNLESGATRREVPDGRTRGLYFILQPSGVASWAVRYRRNGRNQKLTIGRYPEIDLKLARELALKALAEIAAGRDPAAEKKIKRAADRAPADDLVEAAVERFIQRHVRILKSAREPERVLRREVIEPWKGRRLWDISRRDVQKLIDDIVDRPAPILANRLRTYLKGFFAWCVERDLVEANPVDQVRTPSKETSRDRWLDDAELRSVWLTAEALGPPFGSVVQLLILTGQRLGEVAGMRWSELDLAAKLWSLPKERVKNGKAHTVPLSEQALWIIQAQPRYAGCDHVFTANGKTAVVGFAKIKRRLDSLLPANVPPWRLHDLRRSAATGMARIGVDIVVIEKVLNHSSGVLRGIVGVYQRHGYVDERRVALDRWGGHVERLATGETEANVVALKAHG